MLPFALFASCAGLFFAGTILGVNVLAADMCIDPDNTLPPVLTPDQRDLAQLYTYCTGPNAEALKLLAQSNSAFAEVCGE